MRYFLDCEFDGFHGPLISMALVRESGATLYFVIDGAPQAAKDPWVIENVLPILTEGPPVRYTLTREDAAQTIAGFIGDDEGPHIVADWPADLRYFCDLIEFAGGHMAPLPSFTMEVKRIDAYPTTLTGAFQHNAAWDALALRQKVLEMEAEAGHPEPSEDAEGPHAWGIGDVVKLRSGGPMMTVTEVYEPGSPYVREDAIRVAWMTKDGDMNETELPTAALVYIPTA